MSLLFDISRGDFRESGLVVNSLLTLFQIVVEQLTKNVNEGHLREIFGNYGPIKDLKLPLNPACKYKFCYVPALLTL